MLVWPGSQAVMSRITISYDAGQQLQLSCCYNGCAIYGSEDNGGFCPLLLLNTHLAFFKGGLIPFGCVGFALYCICNHMVHLKMLAL